AMTAGDTYAGAGTQFPGGQRSGDGRPATTGQLDEPSGVTMDSQGDLLFSDSANNEVQVVPAGTGTLFGRAMTAGHMYTVAGDSTAGFAGDGGPGIQAELSNPTGVAADAAGNAVISDTANGRVRVVAAQAGTFYGRAMTARDVYTVAGGGTKNPGDGGPATKAILGPAGVVIGAAGSLVIADSGHQRIRMVAARA